MGRLLVGEGAIVLQHPADQVGERFATGLCQAAKGFGGVLVEAKMKVEGFICHGALSHKCATLATPTEDGNQ